MAARIDFHECFRTGDERHTLGDALAQFDAKLATIVETETVTVRNASGRILAQDLVATHDIPPHDNSAMDGYAIHFDDLDPHKATLLTRGPRIAAGHPYVGAIARGQAAEIFTGAPIPVGSDTVVMAEDVREDGARIAIPAGIVRGAHIRRAGEDVRRGETVLRAGLRLRAQDIGMIASLGHSTVAVYRRLRVAVFSTGDEVREPGEALAPGAIFDINRYTLMALLERLGCAVTDLGILPDREAVIRQAVGRASETHDLILTSGGVSVGEEDHVKAAVETLGSLHVWRLAIKPGRPIALGQVGRVPFVGLPGNPVAAMVTFLRIVRPLILKLAGAANRQPAMFRVRAAFEHRKKTGRREWVRVSLVPDGAGGLEARKFPREGAGILSSMVASDGLAELPEDLTRLEPGTMVDVLPFAEVL